MSTGWDSDLVQYNDVSNIGSTISHIQFVAERRVYTHRIAFRREMHSINSDMGPVPINANNAINDDDPLTIEELQDLEKSVRDFQTRNYLVISERMKGPEIIDKILEFSENE